MSFPRLCSDLRGQEEKDTQPKDLEATVHPLGAVQKSMSHSPCPLCRLFATLYPQRHKLMQRMCVLKAFSALHHHFRFSHRRKDIPDTTILSLGRPGSVIWKPNRQREIGIIYPAKQDGLHHQGIYGKEIDPCRVDYKALKIWIQHCRANHKGYCKGHLSAIAFTIPGFRLIDCQTRQVSKPTEEVEYVALSYVWGNGSHASTRALPNPAHRVIEDAMTATKELGFRYLWVDRYCISQLDTAESRTQIANMDRIYASAVCTIAAAAGDGPSYGLPGVSQRHRHVQPHASIGKLRLVASPPPPKDVIRASKWASRGWTFQESKLSRRTLFFTDDQVVFECASMTCEESIYVPLTVLNMRPHKGTGGEFKDTRIFPPNGPGASFINIQGGITEYTSRALTNESDNLNAFLGIFNSFRTRRFKLWNLWEEPTSKIEFRQEATQMHHVWDLPILPRAAMGNFTRSYAPLDINFCTMLAWRSESSSTRSCRFPSWSWAGWKLPKKTHLRHYTQPEWLQFNFAKCFSYPYPLQPAKFWLYLGAGEIIAIDDLEHQSDISGTLRKASHTLIVQGHIRKFRFRLTKNDESPLEPITSSDEVLRFWPDIEMSSDELGKFVECEWEGLNISWSFDAIFWLVLKRVGIMYERIGVLGGVVSSLHGGVTPGSMQSFGDGKLIPLR